MRLIVLRDNQEGHGERSLLRAVLAEAGLADMVLGAQQEGFCSRRRKHFLSRPAPGEVLLAVPETWTLVTSRAERRVLRYGENITLDGSTLARAKRSPWLLVSDGRFVCWTDLATSNQMLRDCDGDVLLVSLRSQSGVYREKACVTSEGSLVGFRRMHANRAEPAPVPDDWPHHVFIRTAILDQVLPNGILPSRFAVLRQRVRTAGLRLRSVRCAAAIADLQTDRGLLDVMASVLDDAQAAPTGYQLIDSGAAQPPVCVGDGVSDRCRFVGKVLAANDVKIGADAVIAGPAVLGAGVKIGEAAVVRSAVVTAGSEVADRQFVCDKVLQPESDASASSDALPAVKPEPTLPARSADCGEQTVFRTWPKTAYPNALKRIADVAAALLVLIMLAPIFPFIVLAIKISSPGPVFYKDRRQGRHGRAFDCIKFRTMKVGAADIQQTLRFVSEVDGPQFKMADDPRITGVGRFLRETYLDEIPQFLNVLMGQMSVVGPRPSPESENTLCPFWRDARLSVRPGVTGLWQVRRTRKPFQDFQEWIYYDTRYVRELSMTKDLWICWATFCKMVGKFAAQF